MKQCKQCSDKSNRRAPACGLRIEWPAVEAFTVRVTVRARANLVAGSGMIQVPRVPPRVLIIPRGGPW
jgi:uncharacterized protein YraI